MVILMSRGRRYDNTKDSKLNIKKVVAVIIALIVIIMFAILVVKAINKDSETTEKNVALAYYTVYENGKWGVINSKGETIINPSYDEMIVIPNPEKDVFLVTYDVNYEDGTYKSKAINSKNEQLFTEYSKVEAIQNQDIQNSVWYVTTCLKVEKDGQYGLIDFSGKTLLDCTYDEIKPVPYVKNSLITVKDDKQGLVSGTGTVIINNEYKEVLALTNDYEDGYIVKNENGQYGAIGTNKKIAIPVQYDGILNVKSGEYYVVEDDGKLKLYNSSTEQTVNIDASDVKSINGENIIAKKNDKYGIINASGEQVLEAKYDDLAYLFLNSYLAKLDNEYRLIDNMEEQKTFSDYKSLTYRKDADFIEGEKEGSVNTDIMDRNFEVKVSGIISEINTSKGYIKVRVGSEYKYYNFKLEEKKNTEILTENTLFLAKKDGKYGYVNKDGVVVVNYIYDDAMEQNASGYVAVKKDGKWGTIDQTGKVVVEPSVDLENNAVIDFIGGWHLAEDTNAGYYTR